MSDRRIRRIANRFMCRTTPARIRNMVRRLRKLGLTWRQIRTAMGLQRKKTAAAR